MVPKLPKASSFSLSVDPMLIDKRQLMWTGSVVRHCCLRCVLHAVIVVASAVAITLLTAQSVEVICSMIEMKESKPQTLGNT